VNLLAPAAGSLEARGEVVRAGRTLTVCRGDAFARSAAGTKHVATLLATMMALPAPAWRRPRDEQA
jgi:acyl-coenzyme A thioesterase PaaI-like protein